MAQEAPSHVIQDRHLTDPSEDRIPTRPLVLKILSLIRALVREFWEILGLRPEIENPKSLGSNDI
jgi:hypothetical protein